MQMDHSVSFGGQEVGRVRVSRSGLYYRFQCRCQLSGDIICRLWAECGAKRENLGVVVPADDGFALDTRVPVKRIGEGELRFVLTPKLDRQSVFIPICPEEPFQYIARLKDAFLAAQNGQAGILIPPESANGEG